MLKVGVCGTDAEICGFEYGGTPPAGEEYLVVGHEALGEVVEAGSSAAGLRPGDLAVPMVRRPCPLPECPACRSGPGWSSNWQAPPSAVSSGLTDFCAEEITEDERVWSPVSKDLRAVAVLTEPLTVAEKGLRQFLGVRRRLPWLADAPDEGVDEGPARRGARRRSGGIARLHATTAPRVRRYGLLPKPAAQSEGRCSRVPGRCLLLLQEVPLADVARQMGGIDLVYEATGAAQLAFDALEHLGANGVFIFTGVPGRKHRIEIAGDAIMRRLVLQNQTVLGTVNAGRVDFESAIRDLASARATWPGTVETIVTGRSSMEQFCQRAAASDGIKSVIAVHVSCEERTGATR